MNSRHRFLLIRHCQAVGQLPQAELTEVGEVQAGKLAEFLSKWPVDFIKSSTYVRAQQSILPFASFAGLPLNLDERLTERILSTSPIENWRQVICDSFEDLDLHAAGGESGREVQVRTWEAVHETLRRGRQLPILVTHGNLISLFLHSLDPGFGYEQWESLSNPDVFLVQDTEEGNWQFERIWL